MRWRMSQNPTALLREVWRVLASGGQLLAVVPNRRGLWARMDTTPFGHGRPYSRSQITQPAARRLVHAGVWSEALYVPPIQRGWFLRSAVAWERVGATISAPFAGVHIVDATKQVYRAIPARREKRVLVPALKPALAPSPGSAVRHSLIKQQGRAQWPGLAHFNMARRFSCCRARGRRRRGSPAAPAISGRGPLPPPRCRRRRCRGKRCRRPDCCRRGRSAERSGRRAARLRAGDERRQSLAVARLRPAAADTAAAGWIVVVGLLVLRTRLIARLLAAVGLRLLARLIVRLLVVVVVLLSAEVLLAAAAAAAAGCP